MPLDPDVCYRALRTRDARFDGRFFTCVRTTGIYCRPVCPARTPKRENCTFLPSAAAAFEAGYRPCLRCRPEASPDAPAWNGTGATVTRALRLIAEGALDEGDVAALGARLGVGDRHLRRLFDRHVGASPVAVAQTRRVALAKQLLDGTTLPMADVAVAAGFGSERRFRDAIQGAYRRPPRALRRERAGAKAGASPRRDDLAGPTLEIRLPFRAPYPWARVLAFLAARAIPGVEAVTAGAYRRSFDLDGARGWLEVAPAPKGDALTARLHVTRVGALGGISARLRGVFDLDADPAAITAHLAQDPLLAPVVRHGPGLRVPGAWDPFELAVRALLGQQVSVAAASTLAGRLVAAFGEELDADAPAGAAADGDAPPCRLFPVPETLAAAEVQRIGLPRARAAALRTLAEAAASDPTLFSVGRDLEHAVARLRALPGVGAWTAHYVAMRALREPDAFPASDLGLLEAFARLEGRPRAGAATAKALAARAEAWRPWRAYAAIALWSTLPGPEPRRR